MRSLLCLVVSTFLLCIFTSSSFSQPVLAFNRVIGGLNDPVDIVNAGDGSNRLFIVQQGGLIRIWNGTTVLATPFADLTGVISTGGERGLLSMAFHPRYDTNRYFFIYYTTTSGSVTSINIARMRTRSDNPNLADAASRVVLITIPKPANRTNHNGGDLNFGPDGKLYFGTGDGGSGGDPDDLAQDSTSLLGKMIRINVDSFNTAPFYVIPPDNPYTSNPNIRDEIFAMGLRNPWRWSFDRLTNDVWIADVGQNVREKVNFRTFAQSDSVNYGWRCYEGNNAHNLTDCRPAINYLFPIFDYPHNSTGGFSVTGGFVYRGTQYPALYGYYIFADYVSGNVWRTFPNGSGGWTTTRQAGLPGNIAGFGEAENGELYAASLSSDSIYQVIEAPILPVNILSFNLTEQQGLYHLTWAIANNEDAEKFIVEYSTDGRLFSIAGDVTANGFGGKANYELKHAFTQGNKIYYRLKVIEKTGTIKYSEIIQAGSTNKGNVKIYPTVLRKGEPLYLISSEKVLGVSIADQSGRIVIRPSVQQASGFFNIQLAYLPKGSYIITVITIKGQYVQRLIAVE